MTENELDNKLTQAAEVLKERIGHREPTVALVLGSGLGFFADTLEDAMIVPFSEVPSMKCSTAAGHKGQFVCGKLVDKIVIAMQGRLHGYEGNTPQEVAFPIWLMQRLGAEVLITTNAAGAINETYHVGDFCLMADHINFTGRNPLVGTEPDGLATRFVSLYNAYDPELRALAHEVADREGVTLQEGIYLGLLGPSFETPAEIRMFRQWGADTVAMSVVEEVIAARHVGLRVMGISLCTNMACGIEEANPSDDEVREVANQCESHFSKLITGIVERI